jgi:hypothetical protein
MEHLIIVIIIIIAAGMVGGIVNRILFKKHTIWESIVLGIVAAFLIPLFLYLSKLELLNEAEKGMHINYLYFAGFCLLVGIFPTQVYYTILQRIFPEQPKETTPQSPTTPTLPDRESKVLASLKTEQGKGIRQLEEDTNLSKQEIKDALENLVQKNLAFKSLNLPLLKKWKAI